ncbi:extensin family protein [Algicella marina]|uniref:Extensin family protein n=1 Tax=Algicella marina TaxID=2683284 RepID=A0A6P1T3B6_9RHOB|nr:extensin family protein [Algicella marina]QHQ36225.1 extensin family protein [Algicella marina]
MHRVLAAFAVLLSLSACGDRSAEILARALNLPADVSSICDMPDMLGLEIDDIGKGSGGCGISDPVKVYAVGGIKLAAQPRLNCRTALALHSWATNEAQEVAKDNGVVITEMRVVAGYACRGRNNRRGARLSEHAKGNAVDIAGFTFSNGDRVTVLGNWNGRKYGRMMKALHASACGPFGTVLGPKSDAFHRDHFHLDTADYRSGAYCR